MGDHPEVARRPHLDVVDGRGVHLHRVGQHRLRRVGHVPHVERIAGIGPPGGVAGAPRAAVRRGAGEPQVRRVAVADDPPAYHGEAPAHAARGDGHGGGIGHGANPRHDADRPWIVAHEAAVSRHEAGAWRQHGPCDGRAREDAAEPVHRFGRERGDVALAQGRGRAGDAHRRGGIRIGGVAASERQRGEGADDRHADSQGALRHGTFPVGWTGVAR